MTMIVAIDGPAASGKGTIAKQIAGVYGLHHLDTGLLYRAVAKAVLDGRDIGTVIAPGADVKLFVVASPEVRAARRVLELQSRGEPASKDEVLADLLRRDERDSRRTAAPLKPAPDAHLLDTTHLDIDAAVRAAIAIVEAARAG